MRFDKAFTALNLALVLISVTSHEIASGTVFYLILNLVACGIAWQCYRSHSTFRINDGLATLLCLIAFTVMVVRGMESRSMAGVQLLDVRLPIVGQFLTTIQWVYLFREKKPRDYAWSYLITIIHMGTAGLLMPGMSYAFLLAVYTMTGLCTLSAFNVWAELRSARLVEPKTALRLKPRVLLVAVPVTLLLTLPIAGIFVALPRRPERMAIAPQVVRLQAQAVSGFSPRVQLGAIGQIQENPDKVMHLKVFDAETDEPIREPGLLLHGIALDQYAPEPSFAESTLREKRRGEDIPGNNSSGGRRWLWTSRSGEGEWPLLHSPQRTITQIYQTVFPGFNNADYRRIRCDIVLQPLNERYLFAPFAVESVAMQPRRRLWGHIFLHDLWYSRGERFSRKPIRYTVVSRLFKAGPPSRSASRPRIRQAGLQPFLQLHPDLSPRIKELVDRIAPEAECPDDYSKAIRIRDYLSDSNRFSYTLNQEPTPGVEPVEDFLFNLRRGHCEYFAGAMAIMLRCADIPARVVNGFKVVEWNPLGGYYVVRQAHAHSWVEAYLHPDGWRTFDASTMRDAATPHPRFARRWYLHIYDTLETFWAQDVLNFDSLRQQEVYARIRNIAGKLGRFFHMKKWLSTIASLYRRGKNALVHWKVLSWDWWITLSVFALVLGALAWLLKAPFRGLRRGKTPFNAAARVYMKMLAVFRRCGFRRAPGRTPWEFYSELVSAQWPLPEAVAAITRDFCLARYGGRELSPGELQRMEKHLQEVRAACRQWRKRKRRSS